MNQKIIVNSSKDTVAQENTRLVTELNTCLVKIDNIGSDIRTKKLNVDIYTTRNAWNIITRSHRIMDALQYTHPDVYYKAYTYHQIVCDDLRLLLEESPQSYRELRYSYHNDIAYNQSIYRYIKILEDSYQSIKRDISICEYRYSRLHRDVDEKLQPAHYLSNKKKDVRDGLDGIHTAISFMYKLWPAAVANIGEESHPHIYYSLRHLVKKILIRSIAITVEYITICCDLIEDSTKKNTFTDQALFSQYDKHIGNILEVVKDMCFDSAFMDLPSLCSFDKAQKRFDMLRIYHDRITG